MEAGRRHWSARIALGLLLTVTVLATGWLLAAHHPADPALAQEHVMAQKWNPAAIPPPIDVAQPTQVETATFAVG